MADVFYPDLSGNGKGVVDLDDVVHSEVEIMTNLCLTLSGLGATPGVDELTGLSINASSNVLNSSTAVFASTDVGKAIVISGAGQALAAGGNDKHRTIITVFVNSQQVQVQSVAAATVAGVEGVMGWDASTYLQTAMNTLHTNLGGTLVIDGSYISINPVTKDFTGANSPQINIVGLGSDSALWVATSISTDVFSLSNCMLNVTGISFVGTRQARSDFRRLFNLTACTAIFERCLFVGLIAMDGIIRTSSGTILFTKHCSFYGCFCVGESGLIYGTIDCHDWQGYRDDYSIWRDFGPWRGKTYSKSGYSGTRAWVRMRTPTTQLGTNRQSTVHFCGSRFDEGSLNCIVVEPVTGTVDTVVFEGTRHNITAAETGRGMHMYNVTDVKIINCSFGWAPATAYLGWFENCKRVVLDNATVTASVDTIVCRNVQRVEIINHPANITTLNFQNTNYHPIETNYTPFAKYLLAAPTDASFLYPPAIGTQVLDRANNRIYWKKLVSEGWLYFGSDGGVGEGPELVTNGTFTTNTTGWTTANGATFVMNSGAGRLTNVVTGGKAYQSFPVVIGTTYRGTLKTVGGTAGAILGRFGVSLDDPTYANVTALGTTTTFTFTAITATLWITLIINAATGTYYDFDDVSIKAI